MYFWQENCLSIEKDRGIKMEVVPVVTQILYYTIGLLAVSLIVNFLIYKFKKAKEVQSDPPEVRKLTDSEIAEKLNIAKPKSKKKEKLQEDAVTKRPTNPNHFQKKLEDYQKPNPQYVVRRKSSKSYQEKYEISRGNKETKALDFRTEFR